MNFALVVARLAKAKRAFARALCTAVCVPRAVKLPADLNPREARRKVVAKMAAPVVALLVLVICMIAPVMTFALVSGVPLDAEMPGKAGWLLVVGGGLGAGAAYLSFRALLLSLGGFKSHEIDAMWHGETKNT